MSKIIDIYIGGKNMSDSRMVCRTAYGSDAQTGEEEVDPG